LIIAVPLKIKGKANRFITQLNRNIREGLLSIALFFLRIELIAITSVAMLYYVNSTAEPTGEMLVRAVTKSSHSAN